MLIERQPKQNIIVNDDANQTMTDRYETTRVYPTANVVKRNMKDVNMYALDIINMSRLGLYYVGIIRANIRVIKNANIRGIHSTYLETYFAAFDHTSPYRAKEHFSSTL